MIVHGFDMHRVYLSAPGDLDAEKQLCRTVISEINERDAMPHRILLVSVGLPQESMVEGHRGPVADNIRQSAYFIQVFEDDWGPKNIMRKMFFLACDARADETLPMREVVVFLKAAPRETDAEVLAFRQELAALPDVEVVTFQSTTELRAGLVGAANRWVRQIRENTPAASAASGN